MLGRPRRLGGPPCASWVIGTGAGYNSSTARARRRPLGHTRGPRRRRSRLTAGEQRAPFFWLPSPRVYPQVTRSLFRQVPRVVPGWPFSVARGPLRPLPCVLRRRRPPLCSPLARPVRSPRPSSFLAVAGWLAGSRSPSPALVPPCLASPVVRSPSGSLSAFLPLSPCGGGGQGGQVALDQTEAHTGDGGWVEVRGSGVAVCGVRLRPVVGCPRPALMPWAWR